MSFASLVGLPDTPDYGTHDGCGPVDRWYFVESEMYFDIDAEMPWRLWEMGDEPVKTEYKDDGCVSTWAGGYVKNERYFDDDDPMNDITLDCSERVVKLFEDDPR